MNILVGDTETNGMISWKEPSESEHQPHCVQLAALRVDPTTQDVLEQMDVIIKPDGWIIPQETIDIHGITMERAMDEGIPEVDALDMYMALHSKCGLRVFHNSTWDNRILRIMLKRFRPDLVTDEEWKDASRYYCTMVQYSKHFGGKWPKLAEAYEFLFNEKFENAHSAMGDTKACMRIYFKLQELTGTVAV